MQNTVVFTHSLLSKPTNATWSLYYHLILHQSLTSVRSNSRLPSEKLLPKLRLILSKTLMGSLLPAAQVCAPFPSYLDLSSRIIQGMGGCLSVGSNAAKTLAAVLNKPIVGVHHMVRRASLAIPTSLTMVSSKLML